LGTDDEHLLVVLLARIADELVAQHYGDLLISNTQEDSP
jgi:hypothetical protein